MKLNDEVRNWFALLPGVVRRRFGRQAEATESVGPAVEAARLQAGERRCLRPGRLSLRQSRGRPAHQREGHDSALQVSRVLTVFPSKDVHSVLL